MARKAAGKAKGQPKYESLRDRLEQVVDKLERGEETLEDSLTLYEEGVKLIRAAHGILDAAEKKLQLLKPRPDGSFDVVDGESLVEHDARSKAAGDAPEQEPL